jgi:hypothetical protein
VRATESNVKYGSPEWGRSKFGKFRVGNDFPSTGVIKLVDDEVKIQNMYSAMARSKVVCEYELSSSNVLAIEIDGVITPLAARTKIDPQLKANQTSVQSDSKTWIVKFPLDQGASKVTRPNQIFALKELFDVSVTDSSASVRIAPDKIASIWFGQNFKHGNEQIYVVFVKEQMIDERGELIDCHACAATIDAVTYKVVSGSWIPLSKQKNIVVIGSWGEPPQSNRGDLLQLSPTQTALSIKEESSGQGYTNGTMAILAYYEEEWSYLGAVDVSADNAGNCVDPQANQPLTDAKSCWSYTGKIATLPSNDSLYPNIVVDYKGTKLDEVTGKLIPAGKTLFVFNGKEYVDSNKLTKK